MSGILGQESAKDSGLKITTVAELEVERNPGHRRILQSQPLAALELKPHTADGTLGVVLQETEVQFQSTDRNPRKTGRGVCVYESCIDTKTCTIQARGVTIFCDLFNPLAPPLARNAFSAASRSLWHQKQHWYSRAHSRDPDGDGAGSAPEGTWCPPESERVSVPLCPSLGHHLPPFLANKCLLCPHSRL